MKKVYFCIIFVIFAFLINNQKVFALGAKKAHPWITKQAADVWPYEVGKEDKDKTAPKEAVAEFQEYLGTLNEDHSVKGIDWHWTPIGECPFKDLGLANIVAGSTMADYDPPGGSALNHSYDGWRGLGPDGSKGYCATVWGLDYYCGQSAVNFVEELFTGAINHYQQGDKDLAYYDLGKCAHLLQDMSTPAHVHGDVHSLASEFGKMVGLPPERIAEGEDKDLYELYMDNPMTHKGIYVEQAKDLGPLAAPTSPRDLLIGMAGIAAGYSSNDIGEFSRFGWKWKITPNIDNVFTVTELLFNLTITTPDSFDEIFVEPGSALKDAQRLEFTFTSLGQELIFKLKHSYSTIDITYSGSYTYKFPNPDLPEGYELRSKEIPLTGPMEVRISDKLAVS